MITGLALVLPNKTLESKLPEYDTRERTRESLRLELGHPPVTGYRVMVTATAISFGITKAILCYRRLKTASTVVEWHIVLLSLCRESHY